MVEKQPISTSTPELSIIISVYNDWSALDSCLHSLSQQLDGPSFEIIVVDDGSSESAPDTISQWEHHFPLVIVRQSHQGIPAARNRGIQVSKGLVLLFVDADCRVQPNCLANLAATIASSTQHNFFQLHLTGDCSGAVGRAEELRLKTFQEHTLQPDGRIRYLNTAGFAIRRSTVNVEKGLFDPTALRAEDTVLLASLMQRGELPLFVADASIQHTIPLSLIGCFRKDIQTAYLERTAYSIIASKGVKIRVNQRERLAVLLSMWKASSQRSIGRSAWFVLVARQTVQRLVSVACRFL